MVYIPTIPPDQVKKINKMLEQLDDFLADEPNAEALYQILSGSVRGPDNSIGKSESTMRLRRVVFPRTCAANKTGMMHGAGTPQVPAAALHHFQGHVGQAIGFLVALGRLDAADVNKAAEPLAAKTH